MFDFLKKNKKKESAHDMVVRYAQQRRQELQGSPNAISAKTKTKHFVNHNPKLKPVHQEWTLHTTKHGEYHVDPPAFGDAGVKLMYASHTDKKKGRFQRLGTFNHWHKAAKEAKRHAETMKEGLRLRPVDLILKAACS